MTRDGIEPVKDWANTRVLVTGGAGFIGSALVSALVARGVKPSSLVVPRHADTDLRDAASCLAAMSGCDVVFHLAASTGGIAFSSSHPASQYRDCSLMDLAVFDAARTLGVQKLVTIGNLLAYPARATSPLVEGDLFGGPLAETHLGIGQAKRDAVLLARMYQREFGLNAVTVLSANAYGPRDRFDPAHSHVIPATIVKCHRDAELVVWGDGSATRDFLYVDDVAEGLILAAESLPAAEYVNLASGTEISIKALVELVAELSGFAGRIVFDTSKPGGDAKRLASTERCAALLGFRPRMGMREGLAETVDYFRKFVRDTM